MVPQNMRTRQAVDGVANKACRIGASTLIGGDMHKQEGDCCKQMAAFAQWPPGWAVSLMWAGFCWLGSDFFFRLDCHFFCPGENLALRKRLAPGFGAKKFARFDQKLGSDLSMKRSLYLE